MENGSIITENYCYRSNGLINNFLSCIKLKLLCMLIAGILVTINASSQEHYLYVRSDVNTMGICPEELKLDPKWRLNGNVVNPPPLDLPSPNYTLGFENEYLNSLPSCAKSFNLRYSVYLNKLEQGKLYNTTYTYDETQNFQTELPADAIETFTTKNIRGYIRIGISPPKPKIDSIKVNNSSVSYILEGITTLKATFKKTTVYNTNLIGYQFEYRINESSSWIVAENNTFQVPPYASLTDVSDLGRKLYLRVRLFSKYNNGPVKFSPPSEQRDIEVRPKTEVTYVNHENFYCEEESTKVKFMVGLIHDNDIVKLVKTGDSSGNTDQVLCTFTSVDSNKEVEVPNFPEVNGNISVQYYGIRNGLPFPFTSYPISLNITRLNPTIGLELLNHTDATCFNGTDGKITIKASNGNPDYTFKLGEESIVSNSQAVFYKQAGSYSVTVTDSRTCHASINNINISQPAALRIVSCNKENVKCYNDSNGKITARAEGGTSPYTYNLIKDNAVLQTNSTGDFNGLKSGKYLVTVKNSNNTCNSVVSDTITIDQPNLLKLKGNPTEIRCFGEKGSIELFGEDGTGDYAFSDDNKNWGSVNIFQNLSPGEKTFYVLDENGCAAELTYNFVEPSNLSLEIASYTPVSCNGGSDSEVILNASGGKEGYYYSYNNNGWQPSNSFTGLSSDSYNFRVKDRNDCISDPISLTVVQPDTLKLKIGSFKNISCNGGNDGLIQLVASGGNSNYQFSKNGEDSVDGALFENLSASNYHFVVTDEKGCTADVDKELFEPNPITVNTSSQNVSCYGLDDGQISIRIEGGSEPYTITVNDSDTHTTSDLIRISNLAASNYDIKIVDNLGCKYNFPINITISEPKEPLSATVNVENITCFGAGNGIIKVTPHGGTPNYSYSLNNGTAQETISSNFAFNNLNAGSYSIKLIDKNNCEFVQDGISITEPSKLEVDFEKTDLSCYNADDGSITFYSKGGTLPYFYSTDNGATFITTEAAKTISNLKATNYSLIVKDSKNCTSSIETIAISSPPPFLLNVEGFNDVSCYNGNDGLVKLSATGGNPVKSEDSLIYSFSKDDSEWIESGFPIVVNQLSSNNYTFRVRDSKGCEANVKHYVNQPKPITASKTIQNIKCKGDNNGSININMDGGKSPYNIQAFFPNETVDIKNDVRESTNFSNLLAGSYTLKIIDSLGCVSEQVVEINEPLEFIQLSIDSIHTPSCYGDYNGKIYLSSTGGWGNYVFSIENTSISNTQGILNNLASGNYNLIATDSEGCATSTSVYIDQPNSLALLEPQITPLTCAGNNTGIIMLNATGGTPSYEFGVGGSYTKENFRENLAAGNYNISVRDSKGCITSAMVTVVEPERLNINLSNTNQSGFSVSCTDSVRVKPIGGIAPYTIQLIDTDTICPATGYLIHSKPSGNYLVTITDSNGCKTTTTAALSNLPGPKINSIIVENTSCSYSSDGKITVNASSLTNLVRVEWEDGRNGNNINNLLSGTYRAIVVDEYGCSCDTLIMVLEPDSLTINLVELRNPTCHNFTDGSIKIESTGGNNPLFHRYQWNNESQSQQINSLPFGTYTVKVIDSKGCEAVETYSLVNPPSIQPSLPSEKTICSNQTLELSAGVPGLNFLWHSNNGFTATTPGVEISTAGTYILTVTDVNGCTGRDTLVLKTDSGIIDADFLMADSASVGDTLAIIETSWPIPDALQWIYPTEFDEFKRTDYTVFLIPKMEGKYTIGLITYLDPCTEYTEKQIKIGPYKPRSKPTNSNRQIIQSLRIIPNPNNGIFAINVELGQVADIDIEIFSMRGEKITQKRLTGSENYRFETSINGLPGIYLVKVISGKESKSIRFVLQ